MSQLVKIVSTFYESAPALCWCIFFAFVIVLITISLLTQQTIKNKHMENKDYLNVCAVMKRGDNGQLKIYANDVTMQELAVMKEHALYVGDEIVVLIDETEQEEFHLVFEGKDKFRVLYVWPFEKFQIAYDALINQMT